MSGQVGVHQMLGRPQRTHQRVDGQPFPVAEAASQRESVYVMENVSRDGPTGVEHAVEALGKIQRNAHELPVG